MLSAKKFKKRFIDHWEPTPLLQKNNLWFKLEHKNPTGSIKARGLVYQVHNLLKSQQPRAVISSSGNAGIAAAYYARAAGIKMTVVIPTSVTKPTKSNKKIKQRLDELGAQVIQAPANTIQIAKRYAKKHQARYIRQSTDPTATQGFKKIATELDAQLSQHQISLDETSIFWPVGSGTGLVGFWEGLLALKTNTQKTPSRGYPQIHLVQHQAAQSVAAEFDKTAKRKARGIIKGWVRKTPRKQSLIKIVTQSNGNGWIPNDQLIKKAHQKLKNEYQINQVSLGGALAYAGYQKATATKFKLKKYPLITLT